MLACCTWRRLCSRLPLLAEAVAEGGGLGRPLGARRNSIHNLYFYQDFTARMREALEQGRFEAWTEEFRVRRNSGVVSG
jgi:queuine/archaeosine tRNA-ribosyltransferase